MDGHWWARYIMLKVILEAGQGCVTVEQTNSGLYINLNKSKIDSVGMPAVRIFLKKLQAYKSTADVKGATALCNKYAIDLRDELPWALASLCVDIRSKAIMFVQPNTVLTEEGGVDLVTYDETPEGVILSVIDRYTMESVANLEELWNAEKKMPLRQDYRPN